MGLLNVVMAGVGIAAALVLVAAGCLSVVAMWREMNRRDAKEWAQIISGTHKPAPVERGQVRRSIDTSPVRDRFDKALRDVCDEIIKGAWDSVPGDGDDDQAEAMIDDLLDPDLDEDDAP